MSDLRTKDGLIKENWFIACLSKELKSKPLLVTLYDTPIVLFRDEKARASALLDKCCHRAVPLSKGEVKNGCIICPYHSWTYDAKGALKEIPSLHDKHSLPKVSLKSFPLIEKDGVIWLWMGEGDSCGEPWSFPLKNDKAYVSYYMVTDFDNEVGQLVENFIDVAHTITVHKGWFRKESKKEVKLNINVFNGRVDIDYFQPQDSIGVLLSKLINPKNKPMLHRDSFIYPNLTRVDYTFSDFSHWVINSQCSPISRMKTRVYTHIAYKMPIIGRLIKPLISFYTRRVIEQDVDIMKVQSDNLKKFNDSSFSASEVDAPHVFIDKLRKIGVKNPEKVNDYKNHKSIDMLI